MQPEHGEPNEYNREQILDLAKRALDLFARRGLVLALEPEEFKNIHGPLAEPGTCFVTLTKQGELRGCVGSLQIAMPLYKSIIRNAIGAGFSDSRFDPVQPKELPELKFEVSVLTAPEPLKFETSDDLLSYLKPGQDGVVITLGEKGAVFLPQVWESFTKPEDFLSALCVKAKLAPNDWKNPELKVEVFKVEAIFAE